MSSGKRAPPELRQEPEALRAGFGQRAGERVRLAADHLTKPRQMRRGDSDSPCLRERAVLPSPEPGAFDRCARVPLQRTGRHAPGCQCILHSLCRAYVEEESHRVARSMRSCTCSSGTERWATPTLECPPVRGSYSFKINCADPRLPACPGCVRRRCACPGNRFSAEDVAGRAVMRSSSSFSVVMVLPPRIFGPSRVVGETSERPAAWRPAPFLLAAARIQGGKGVGKPQEFRSDPARRRSASAARWVAHGRVHAILVRLWSGRHPAEDAF